MFVDIHHPVEYLCYNNCILRIIRNDETEEFFPSIILNDGKEYYVGKPTLSKEEAIADGFKHIV